MDRTSTLLTETWFLCQYWTNIQLVMNPYTVGPHVYYVCIGRIAIIDIYWCFSHCIKILDRFFHFLFFRMWPVIQLCVESVQTTDNFGPSPQTCQSPSKLWIWTVPFHKIWIYNTVCFHHLSELCCVSCVCVVAQSDHTHALWMTRHHVSDLSTTYSFCVLSNLLKKRETLSHADFHVIMETCHARGVCEDNNYHNTHVVR